MMPHTCPLCGSIAFPTDNGNQKCTGSSCAFSCKIGMTKSEALHDMNQLRIAKERMQKQREEEQEAIDEQLRRNNQAGYNAGWELSGNTLIIYIPNMNADYGYSKSRKSKNVASRVDHIGSNLHFTLNVYRPIREMNVSTCENANILVRNGGRINIEIIDLKEDLGLSSSGNSRIVAHAQESVRDVVVQLSVYRY